MDTESSLHNEGAYEGAVAPHLSDDTSSDIARTRHDVGKRAEAGEWIGRQVGKYHITGLLGVGGMGLVYEAQDRTLDRAVAIKILPSELANEERTRRRFLAEAKAAAKLNDRHVVQIHEVDEFEGTHYIVMELVRGRNTAERIDQEGAYELDEATEIVIQACRGMAAAHAAGLVHRDIKPGNLMRAEDGTVKVGDFGLAKGIRRDSVRLTREGTALGTPAYMSPEQCEGRPADARSDVYSLGGTYYTLITGHDPYEHVGSAVQVMYAHCRAPIVDPREIDPAIPASCAAIIARAMAKKPEDRYQSADAMRVDLERLLQSQTKTVVFESGAVPPDEAPSPTALSRRSLVLGGSALLGLAAVGGYWFPWSSGATDQGVTHDTITFGTSTAYSGASRDLGVNMVQGLHAAFGEVNAAGGVHGRRLELVVLDDGYEPERTLANMVDLLDERRVFGIVGNVGTPTAEVAAPFAISRRRLFFAPFSGAQFLRPNPSERYVFNVRASYADETSALVRHFVEVEHVPPEEIAVFAQDDSYGDDGFRGVARALRGFGIEESAILRVGHARNTVRVDEAVESIIVERDQVSAIVMVSTHAATPQFVKGVRDAGVEAAFGAVSFVGSNLLAERFHEIGAEYGDGVIVTEVVPNPRSNATGVIRYREALAKYVPEARLGSVSLEGDIAGRCLVEGLRGAGRHLDTESLVDALEEIRNLDLGIGTEISFTPSDHQASHQVWAMRLDGHGKYHPVDLGER